MAAMRVAAPLVFANLIALCFAEITYNPTSAKSAIDVLEQALHGIMDNPRLSAAQLKVAKKVAVDVESTCAELESAKGKSLTDKERNQKVTASIKELQSLQTLFLDNVAKAAAAEKKAEEKEESLKEEVAEKKALLEKDQKMMQVVSMEKELAEKKLQLHNMIDAKEQQEAKQRDSKAQAEQQEMVSKLVNMAKAFSAAKAGNGKAAKSSTASAAGSAFHNQAVVKPILEKLKSRISNLTASVQKIEADEKSDDAKLDAALKKQGANASAQEKSMLRRMKKEEHRGYEKTKAVQKTELAELTAAVHSIEKGDVVALKAAMLKMQTEMKAMQAKTQDFLH
eukprot:gnl/TRDRNA2_/TRDRNA2_174901_c0_seq1.p1 gnl/TRDRNA2_/TRDRNA2_174901_c0~~gnl/TRDRNA2_/TRDRNA2_174901_c0_seq1.p1  ORF type:complete len:361 (-),score=139.45 gnl/TRDRNA2_/TRDRNA2_174901_c0_seq1:351-1367(-)